MDKDMMNKDNEIQKTNGMTKVSEEEIESVTGGVDYQRYNDVYNSGKSLGEKRATLYSYLTGVKASLRNNKDLTTDQKNDLIMKKNYLESLILKLGKN